MSVLTNEHIHTSSILGSEVHSMKEFLCCVNSRIGRGGGGGGLKHMFTVHPLMFRLGVVCGGLRDTVISYCF